VPASSGAKAPLACEDRTLVGCARASINGCRSRQASPRSREARLPLATGRVDGGLALEGSKGSSRVKRRRSFAGRRPSRPADEVRSRALERALRGDGPCSMEDTSDHCGSALRSRGHEAGDLGGLRDGACSRERHDHLEGGDRGVRGSVRTRPRREDNARHDGSKRRTCDPPKRIALNVKQAISSIVQAPKAHDASRAHEARVLVRKREMAEVGPTHRASPFPRSRKASRESDAGRGALPTTC